MISSAESASNGALRLANDALNAVLKIADVAKYTTGSGVKTLNFGDLVQFVATYDTAQDLFSFSSGKIVTLQTVDTVHVSRGFDPQKGVFDQIYSYIGKTTLTNFNLETANFLDTTLWAVAVGSNGGVYRFMGADGTPVDLGTGTPQDAHGVAVVMDAPGYSTNTGMTASGAFTQTATNSSTINATVSVASAAMTIAGIGGSAAGSGASANNKISIDTEATVNQSGATGISVGSLTLDAEDTSSISTDVSSTSTSITAGIGASVSVGVSEASNTIDNGTQASITSASVTTTTGDATVKAIESTSITASSQASASSSGLAAASGGADAINTITTTTAAYVDSSTLTIKGKLWIDAEDVSTATATTGSSSIASGLISFAGGGEVATSTINNNVTARIGDVNSNVTAGEIEVDASAAPEGKAVAYGVAASSLAVGASLATVTVTPVVSSTVGGTITAGSLTVNAKLNLPATGHAAASASAYGAVGALIGVTASNANATSNATITAGIAASAIVVVSGSVIVAAVASTQQRADGSNATIGLVAAGAAQATANANSITKAVIGSGAKVTAGGLSVNATGNDDTFASTEAGSGGVLAGSAAAPTSKNTATTTALIDNSAKVDLTGQSGTNYLLSGGKGILTLGAAHTAKTNTEVTAVGVGLLSGAGADSTNDVVSTVTASFGDSSNVKALKIQVNSTNTVLKPALANNAANIEADTGGLAAAASANSNTWLSAGRVRLVSSAPLLVPANNLSALENKDVAFVTGSLGAWHASIAEASARRHIVTISNDLACVTSGYCVMGVRSEPRVQVIINRKLADRSSIDFAPGFRLLVTEL